MSRVALVIGNESYKRLDRLKTPRNDVIAIARKLTELDFDVDVRVDVERSKFTEALIQFEHRMEDAETSLFFFAGHGFQFNEQNYLAPVDIEGERDSDLTWRSIEVKKILESMSRFNQTSLMFLDACRESVMFRRWIERTSALAQTRGTRLTFGFAPIENIKRLSNTFVAFSTEPGGLAVDTVNGRHSPFANALLSYIDEPGLSIFRLMTHVRRDVMRATGEQQVPRDESNLLDDFFFNPGDLIETHDFKAAIRENASPADIDGFLAKYPDTQRRDEAIRILKDQLEDCRDIATMEEYCKKMRTGVCARLTRYRLAELYWEPLRRSKDVGSITAFVGRFPESHEAKERLAELHLIQIETGPNIGNLNDFIDAFGETKAGAKAVQLRQQLRQEVIYEFVSNEAWLKWLRPSNRIFGLGLSILAAIFCVLVVYFSYFSDRMTALISGILALIVAANGLMRDSSIRKLDVLIGFLSFEATSFILVSALSRLFPIQVFGSALSNYLEWIWAALISIIGVAHIGRANSFYAAGYFFGICAVWSQLNQLPVYTSEILLAIYIVLIILRLAI